MNIQVVYISVMEYHCLNPALGEFQLNLVVLVKVKVYVFRIGPVGKRRSPRGETWKNWELQQSCRGRVCGIYIYFIQTTRLATLFSSRNRHLPCSAPSNSCLTHRYQFILLGEQGQGWIEERMTQILSSASRFEPRYSHVAGKSAGTDLGLQVPQFSAQVKL